MPHERLNPSWWKVKEDQLLRWDNATNYYEEFYLQSGILAIEDYEEVALAHPSLETVSYNSMPLTYTGILNRHSNTSRKIVKTFYKCTTYLLPI